MEIQTMSVVELLTLRCLCPNCRAFCFVFVCYGWLCVHFKNSIWLYVNIFVVTKTVVGLGVQRTEKSCHV